MAGSSVGREVLPSAMAIHLLGIGSAFGGVRHKTEPQVFEPASAGGVVAMFNSMFRVVILTLAFLASVSTGHAAVMVTGAYTPDLTPSGAYALSSPQLNLATDPNVTRTGFDTAPDPSGEDKVGGPNRLSDGINGAGNYATVTNSTIVIFYNFATAVDVGSIETYSASGDNQHINQNYRLMYATDAGPGYTYQFITNVAYAPVTLFGGRTKVSITDDASPILASGVTSIALVFADDIDYNPNSLATTVPQNGSVSYTELSIIGVVPEPTSFGILALGALGLLRRRRAAIAG